jgi:hypothetical protein
MILDYSAVITNVLDAITPEEKQKIGDIFSSGISIRGDNHGLVVHWPEESNPYEVAKEILDLFVQAREVMPHLSYSLSIGFYPDLPGGKEVSI